MAESHFVAFDLGAESGRAILGTLSSDRLTLSEKHRFSNPNGRLNGRLYWNILAQWEELKTGLRKCVASEHKLAGIGVDTWGVDFGLIGQGGELLGNPVHYRDVRTAGVMDETVARVGLERIFESTGLQFMGLNTLYQLLALKRYAPQILAIAETMLLMPDLMNYLFTGVRKSEFSIVSTTQMFDPRKRAWATDLLTELELPTRILTEIVPSGSVIGPLRSDVAAECGAGDVPVIAPASHDTASAVVAVPASGEDWCYISSGTWSLMGVELNEPIIHEKVRRYNFTNEGGIGGTIRFLKNISGLWLVQECRRQWAKEGNDHTYAELTQMAARAKSVGAFVDPSHATFQSPGEMPGKIAAFCEQTRQPVPDTRGEVVRCCLESLAMTYRQTLDGLEDILGRKISTIHILGGGSQNELLNQLTADACARRVLAGPIEATAIGNILVQAMAVGQVRDLPHARAIVKESFDVKQYEPRGEKSREKAYAKYRAIVGK